MGDIAEQATSEPRRLRRRSRLRGWLPYILAALVSLFGIAGFEHLRRLRLAGWHEAQNGLCIRRLQAADRSLRAAIASGNRVQAQKSAQEFNYWNYQGLGQENMAKEYRKPLWSAWLRP